MTVSRRSISLKRAGHDQSPVLAVTLRSRRPRSLRRVSFTNPFTRRAVQSLLPADRRRRDAVLHRSADQRRRHSRGQQRGDGT